MTKQWDFLWVNGNIDTCVGDNSLIHNGAIGVKDGKIAWIGQLQELTAQPQDLAKVTHDFEGCLVTPGLIDCHTHIIYAGNRAQEFELRLQGVSYADIALKGGGISSTVKATAAASAEELYYQSLKRALIMLQNGVTTLEIKSGYGLDWEQELKILRVAGMLEETLKITIIKTFLGAHIIPEAYKKNPEVFVDLVCNQMIPQVAAQQLAQHVDVFCETIAFNLKQTEKIFKAAKQAGLNIKCHAEQLSYTGSALLAAQHHALSVDHLEYLAIEDIPHLAKSGTVAVLLPCSYYYLREKKLPPIDELRRNRVPLAIATDCNPGTSPVLSLPLVMNMACTLFNLTPREALLGVTCHAASALGLAKTHGTLEVGKVADFAVWDAERTAELVYYLGDNPLMQLVKNGDILHSKLTN